MKSLQILACSFLLVVAWYPGAAQEKAWVKDKDWHFTLAPYVWTGGINGTLTVSDVDPIEVDIPFREILEDLHISLLLRAEVQKGNWGFIADFFYLNVQAEHEVRLGVLHDEVRETIIELIPFYRFHQKWGYVDVYAGIRYWNWEIDLELEGARNNRTVDVAQGWVEPLLGGRLYYNAPFQMLLSLKADAGGFGAGGSKLTYNIQPGIGYRFSPTFSMLLLYKYLDTDFDNDEEGEGLFKMDGAISGAVIGLSFQF